MLYLALLWSFFHLCYGATYSDVTSHPNWSLLDHDKCGIVSTNRLIGGENARLGEFPWIVQIGVRYAGPVKRPWAWKGVGTLINHLYVLTLASNLLNSDEGITVPFVRLGEYNITTNPDCDSNGLCADKHQDIGVAYIVYHREYKDHHEGNVGLIRLSSRAKLNAFVAPLCLPLGHLREMTFQGDILTVAGFGMIAVSGTPGTRWSTIMQKIQMKIFDPDVCRKAYTFGAQYAHGLLICGRIFKGRRKGGGMCQADFGVPLMQMEVQEGTPRHYLIGVGASFDKRCDKNIQRNLNNFVNTSYYEMWILDNLSP